MDPFQSHEIASMVVRYLAAGGWEDTVTTMIREIPFLKYNVPPHNPHVSKSDYLKLIARPTPIPTLMDLLNDYGKSKLMVSQIIQRQNPAGSPLRQTDSLVTQLKQLSTMMCRPASDTRIVQQQLCLPDNEEDADLNDGNGLCEIPLNNEAQSTDNEEAPTTDPNKVPLMFYNTLLSDPQKLANSINEHLTDTSLSAESKGDMVQKACCQAESEIDRFMIHLLQEDDNSNSCSLSTFLQGSGNNGGVDSNLNMEGGLTNLFDSVTVENDSKDDNNVISPSKVNKTQTLNLNKELTSLPSPSISTPGRILSSNSSVSSTPGTSRHAASMKRIIPIPAPVGTTPRPNPVFEFDEPPSSVKVPSTSTGGSYTVVSTFRNASDWEKLGRRSIVPKAMLASNPEKNKINTPTDPLPNINHPSPGSTALVNKRKAKLAPPVKVTPEKVKNPEPNFCHNEAKVIFTPSSTPSCSSKPTPPPPLPLITPISYQTPVDKPAAPPGGNFKTTTVLQVSHTSEVTPILADPILTNSSTLSTIATNSGIIANNRSPRMIRLIASAQKLRATTTNSKQKSMSTPRKKHYVRNLSFHTPPPHQTQPIQPPVIRVPTALVLASPPNSSSGRTLPLPNKRKGSPVEDLHQLKKPFNWSKEGEEEDGYISSAFGNVRNDSSAQMKENMLLVAQKVVFPKPLPQANSLSPSLLSCPTPMDQNNLNLSNFSEEANISTSFEDGEPSSSSSSSSSSSREISLIEDNPEHHPNSLGEVQANLTHDIGSDILIPPSLTPPEICVSPPTPLIEVEVTTSGLNNMKQSSTTKGKNNYSNKKGKAKKGNQLLVSALFGTEDENSSSSACESTPIKARKTPRKNGTTPSGNPVSPEFRRSPRLKQQQVQSIFPPIPVSLSKRNAIRKKENMPQLETSTTTTNIRKSTSKSPTTPIPTPSRAHRKSKLRLDAIAAKTMADSAVPLGKRASFSPKKKNMAVNVSPEIVSAAQILPTTIPVTVSSINTTTTNELRLTYSTDIMTIHASSSNSTPMKEDFLPFQILPAPIGFPDPTPDKNDPPPRTTTASFFSTLITPMKSSSDTQISPPSTLPPTPRFIRIDPDAGGGADSNSNSTFVNMFRGGGDSSLGGWGGGMITPFKLGPPPTPGRNISLDEHSQAGVISGLVQSVVKCVPSVRVIEKPLDLSPVKTVKSQHSLTSALDGMVPPHVSISRKTPMVIVGKPNTDNVRMVVPMQRILSDAPPSSTAPPDPHAVQFQVPKDIPRKISPLLPKRVVVNYKAPLKEVPSSHSSSRQNQVRTKEAAVQKSSISHIPPQPKKSSRTATTMTNICPDKELLGTSSGIRQPKTVTTFRVNDRKQCLVFSEERNLLPHFSPTLPDTTTIPQHTEQVIKNPLPTPPTAIRNALRKMDFSRFLKTLHKSGQRVMGSYPL